MGTNTVVRELGNLGRRRGQITEDRFFEAWETSAAETIPEWVIFVRRASPEEDSRGIDAVIMTDVGKLFVQIKSSWTGALKFQRRQERRREKPIGIIVIRDHHTPEDIRKELKVILHCLRQRILRIRGTEE